MAHVVGVPRRDPCRKCQLPVFLAERLLVGKKVYHRTCLKCARCGSQLTPGSFYETEIDEQYCCETCPDEEIVPTMSGGELAIAAAATGGSGALAAETSNVQLRNTLDSDATPLSPTTTRTVRSSIRDRLAFFEQQQQQQPKKEEVVDSKLLQKSLSDEEKSKSLQRMENSATTTASVSATYKMNPALSSFLSDTVDNEPEEPAGNHEDEEEEENESESLSSSVQNSKMETSDSEETDDLTSVSQPPELPKTLPPSQMLQTEKKDEDSKRFTASAQLILESTTTTTDESQVVADEQQNIIRASSPEKQQPELQISVTSSRKTNDRANNNSQDNDEDDTPSLDITKETEITQTQETTETIQQIELENKLACNETNDNDCVTKDKATVDVSMETEMETEAAQQLESTTTLTPNKVVDTTKSRESSVEKLETSETVKEPDQVELRTKSPREDDNTSILASPTEDKETTQRLSVVRARLQQFEVITNKEKERESATATNAKEKEKEHLDISQTPKTPPNANESTSRLDLNEETTTVPTPTPAPRRDETLQMDTEIITENLEEPTEIVQEVPLIMETKDNEILENKNKSIESPTGDELKPEEDVEESDQKPDEQNEEKPEQKCSSTPKESSSSTPQKTPSKVALEEYPEDLNPFKSDEEDADEENKENVLMRKPPIPKQPARIISANPFDSSDDEVELEKSQSSLTASTTSTPKIPPPRPPPPRISRNPFGSEDEDEDYSKIQLRRSSLTASQSKRTPVPTPRSNISQSLNPTPEPTPRLGTKIPTNNNNNSNTISSATAATITTITTATTTPQSTSYVLQNSSDFYGSANSLHSNHTTTPPTSNNLLRNSDIRSSNNSLNLSAGGTIRSRKSRRAPLPPQASVKELFPSSETINSSSKASTPSSSTVGTPKSGRKKRPAPAPPKPARLENANVPQIHVDTIETQPKNLLSYPLQSELDSKLSDEEKALLEGKTLQSVLHTNEVDVVPLSPASRRSSKRLIPLDKELLEEHGSQSQCDDLKQQQTLHKTYYREEDEANVVYRRMLIPSNIDTPIHESNPLLDELNKSSMMGERQLEKLKDNKEANNRNRQSQISAASSGAEDNDPLFNKSVHGKWKRRKGPAPALPIPPRKVLQMLPLQEIKHELDIIEVQQQGLEKQGVILEKMIRDRCEGQNGEPLNAAGEVPDISATDGSDNSPLVENSKEVEYLILQLFELVNEKNELFRRQAELMYLRRQHRLEQEQADLEYEIRVLMAQPERNKTDTDKAREEALIERLVEVVQLRNEVVECLEMDRIREAEEDQSIKQRMESHIAKRDDEPETKKSSTSKLSKKEKKKQKESKKLGKNKKLDADKDADESEINLDKQKTKKKKKLLIF